jgi:hypothetical protein
MSLLTRKMALSTTATFGVRPHWLCHRMPFSACRSEAKMLQKTRVGARRITLEDKMIQEHDAYFSLIFFLSSRT